MHKNQIDIWLTDLKMQTFNEPIGSLIQVLQKIALHAQVLQGMALMSKIIPSIGIFQKV